MWFLYINAVYVCKTDDIHRLLDVVEALMFCEGINKIELRPEKEF